MLDSLDAEKFSIGHADIVSRKDIQDYIKEMKSLQDKAASLVGAGKSLDEIKSEFQENQGALVEVIYNEIKRSLR